MKTEPSQIKKTVSTWLQAISRLIGIDLTLTEDGHIEFSCNDKTIITLEVSTEFEVIYFYADLLTLPTTATEREPFYRRALELNAFNAATGPASISLDPRRDALTLTFMEKISDMTADSFASKLNDFIRLTLSIKESNALTTEIGSTQSNRFSSLPHQMV